MFEEALRSGNEIAMIVAAESARDAVARRAGGIRTAIVPDSLFQSLSATETAQGVMTLVKPREWTLTDLLRGHPLVVVLDEVQDPGNAGAIVRAAEAFGATGAIFIKGSVSPYNPKTLRASAGSLFRFPVLAGMDASCARSQLVEKGIELFAAVPAHSGAAPISAADLMRECAVVIGNEAHGVSELWRSSARAVSIPTTSVESLNAAVAAGILLYEARRQRSSAA